MAQHRAQRSGRSTGRIEPRRLSNGIDEPTNHQTGDRKYFLVTKTNGDD